jgi:hypothetical protein
MKKLLTLAFVATLSFVGSMVFADEAATVATSNEAPIVIAPGFGQHGLPYGDQYAGYEGAPGQKVSLLTRIGNRIKAARAAREAKKASQGYGGFDGGYQAPRRKLFAPKAKSNFGGGLHGGYQEFPSEFQVGGYY